MELETLLTGTKWEILELLSKEKLSPLDLANKLNTTIANISQQLRLLETANLIKKEKTGQIKPGKPRTLYSLAEDYAFITILSKGLAKKKLIKINQNQKGVLKHLIS